MTTNAFWKRDDLNAAAASEGAMLRLGDLGLNAEDDEVLDGTTMEPPFLKDAC